LDLRQTATALRLLRRHRKPAGTLPAALRLALGRQLLLRRERKLGQELLQELAGSDEPVAPLAALALAQALKKVAPGEALGVLERLERPGCELQQVRGAELRLRLHRKLGQPVRARDFVRKLALHLYPAARTARLLADALWAARAAGDDDLAMQLEAELLQRRPRRRAARQVAASRPLPAGLLHQARHPPKRSSQALQAAIRARAQATPAERDEHAAAFQLLRGIAALKGAAWGQAQLHFDGVIDATRDEAVLGEALWGRALSLRRRDLDLEAAAAYRSLGRGLPRHLRAAEALEHAARLCRLHDEHRLADRDLMALAAEAPESKPGLWARWQLGWRALRAGRWEEAATTLETLRREAPTRRAWTRGRLGERALFWQAVALERGGDAARALGLRRELLRSVPLSYYGLVTLARHPQLASEVPPAVPPSAPGPASAAAAGEQALATLTARPETAPARALLKAGLPRRARQELRHLLRANHLGPTEVDALAALHAACGDVSLAYRTVRFRGDFGAWPGPATRTRWERYHPRPYSEFVQAAARAEGLDPLLLWAVMRQESGFLPGARSGAGAMGLLQLLATTGRSMAYEVGSVRWKAPRQLYDPETNVRLGAHFIARLLRRYEGRLPLVLAAYNAGPGYVDRWQERFGHLDDAGFTEEAVIERAQGYVKQVLQAYGAYHYLYGPTGLAGAAGALRCGGGSGSGGSLDTP